jgi:hypothetical protein
MERIAVVSKTGMVGVGYDPEAEILEIEFKSRKEGGEGTLYHYHNVSPEEYAAFMAAESKGSHFIKSIKPTKKCVKVLPNGEAVA